MKTASHRTIFVLSADINDLPTMGTENAITSWVKCLDIAHAIVLRSDAIPRR